MDGVDAGEAVDAAPPADLPGWLRPLAAAVAGIDATDLSRFLPPEDGSGRPSAVLIAFAGTAAGPAVLLIERSADLRTHAGQVAFPGGAIDPVDESPAGAALREAQEEVGLDPVTVELLASLPPIYIPVTRFVVTPVLAWWRDPHQVAPVDVAEVARVELVPVADLVEPANRFRVRHPSGWVGPGFAAKGLFVWGFTAGLLDRVLSFGGWSRPWDETQVRSLPVG